MIGDNLLIYNPKLDKFYAGRDWFGKHYVTDKTAPIWTRNIESAKCSHALARYRKICTELGGGVRIVSETEARRIVMMREYREAQNG